MRNNLMDMRSIIDLVCGVLGICIVIFGIIVRTGMLDQVDPGRGMVPIILGTVIALWSWMSLKRRG